MRLRVAVESRGLLAEEPGQAKFNALNEHGGVAAMKPVFAAKSMA